MCWRRLRRWGACGKTVQLVAVLSIQGEHVLQVLLRTRPLAECARLQLLVDELPCLPGDEWVSTEVFAIYR